MQSTWSIVKDDERECTIQEDIIVLTSTSRGPNISQLAYMAGCDEFIGGKLHKEILHAFDKGVLVDIGSSLGVFGVDDLFPKES
jgi:hypothetical protein